LLLYYLSDFLQMLRYERFIHVENFVFVKTKEGELIRKGLTSRNWLILFFLSGLQLVFLWIIFQSLLADPIGWGSLIIVSLLVVFIGWLMGHFFRLLRVSPIHFDPQAKEIRFRDDDNLEHNVPFTEIKQLLVKHAGQGANEVENAPRSTYTISLSLKNSEKSLVLARLVSRSKKKNTQQKDFLIALIDSVIQIDNPPHQLQKPVIANSDTSPLVPLENQIVENLHQIQRDGGESNFVIFQADAQANYYIQLAGQKGSPALYAEAASNQVITDGFQLSQQQQMKIEALGWHLPSPGMMNYSREWQADSEQTLHTIAKIIMHTFFEGYGFAPDSHLDVNLNLE
jgi:hypothetical protein